MVRRWNSCSAGGPSPTCQNHRQTSSQGNGDKGSNQQPQGLQQQGGNLQSSAARVTTTNTKANSISHNC